jgi:undecaprenyl-diphosphatase
LPLLHILILALLQGVTEFLPISSSGHLVVAWEYFDAAGWNVSQQSESQRLAVDIAVHVGTLAAVCLYYWRDLWIMAVGMAKLLIGQWTPGARLALLVILATLPVVGVGYVFKDAITEMLHGDVRIVAWTTIGFGVVLYIADRLAMTVRRIEHITIFQALMIGASQVLALVPGTSRSGITMTAARFFGYERPEAARFSLLLSIPTILGAGVLAGLDLRQTGDAALQFEALVAAVIAFVTALIAIVLMMRWLRNASFTPFVLYRIALGIAILVWFA